ncbi:flagellar hook assembly protein FlgD [Indiicoccus explosivorum]|uniref:flagellar hook assembly protein FlgD n=1 Tax=Indiicoccus explosivorum TaxID=1917864 RepID=UPI000B435A31|nr:flagellar hook assembly protein FlgD [Indiicoccus explosivorum]
MDMKTISQGYYVPAADQLNIAEKSNGSLDKDDFLKILITQLQNQDPTNPMQDREFIAQMAQFSALEQTMNLSKSFESFAAAQQQNQLIQYSSFIGKTVKWHELTGEMAETGKPETAEGEGKITSVRFVDGSVEFLLEDGKKLVPANISEVIGG